MAWIARAPRAVTNGSHIGSIGKTGPMLAVKGAPSRVDGPAHRRPTRVPAVLSRMAGWLALR